MKINIASDLLLGVNIGILTLSLTLKSLVFAGALSISNIFENMSVMGFHFIYFLINGLTYDDPYETNMECSDIVSISNYNIMIQKNQNN